MLVPLLQTKFYIPSPRPHLVRRDHLINRLVVDGARRLTLISAPAGFGKTTLISAWVAQCDHAVVWLSLDDDDNDPTRFLTYLIAALQTHLEDVGTTTLGLLGAAQAPPLKTILTLLLNELGALITPLVLILDDYHLITAPPLHEAVIFLIDHLPPQIQLVITTRMDPPLPLARWRVRNQLAEMRADDLRFTAAEAAIFLNDVMGLTLSDAEIAALEARTEGWIAGLQLAALSMQGRADVTGFIRAFSGSHRHVLSYLVEEVLNRRPEGTLDFLLQTSILEQMSAELCHAVTGNPDSQSILEKLEQANLFLVPLDNEGKWYRYHHLFVEVLRTRLQQAHPHFIPQYHQRASVWYAEHGQIEQAVSHALAIPDVEHAASLIEQMALPALFRHSEVLLVRRLVERLPLTAVYHRPYLTLAYGITLALSGQFEAVTTLLRHAAPTLNSTDLPGDVAGGLAVLDSLLARFHGDWAQALALAEQALQQLPADALALRAAAAGNMGSVYFLQGDRAAANEVFRKAIVYGNDSGAEYIVQVAFEELATEQARQGLLAQAKQTCEQALTRATRANHPLVPASGMALIILGEVLVEWHELEQAAQVLTQGIHLLQATTEMGLLARGYSALARRHWASGDTASALAVLDQGEAWIAQIQTAAPGTHARLAAKRARIQLSQGNLNAARQWEQTTPPPNETQLSYFQQLTRVRIRLAQFAHDPQPSLLSEASDLLTPLLARAEAKGWGSHVIESLLLQALVEQARGQRNAGFSLLARALALAEADGYIRLFVDEGEAMQQLLADFCTSGISQSTTSQSTTEHQPSRVAYAQKLLKLFSPDHPTDDQPVILAQSSPQNLLEPLSSRELEVLQLVAAGLSNTQIADQLIVSTSTVKTHINHIFGKLAVDSRIQAVIRARQLGLIPT